jgi:hypothetical protein
VYSKLIRPVRLYISGAVFQILDVAYHIFLRLQDTPRQKVEGILPPELAPVIRKEIAEFCDQFVVPGVSAVS